MVHGTVGSHMPPQSALPSLRRAGESSEKITRRTAEKKSLYLHRASRRRTCLFGAVILPFISHLSCTRPARRRHHRSIAAIRGGLCAGRLHRMCLPREARVAGIIGRSAQTQGVGRPGLAYPLGATPCPRATVSLSYGTELSSGSTGKQAHDQISLPSSLPPPFQSLPLPPTGVGRTTPCGRRRGFVPTSGRAAHLRTRALPAVCA